MRIFSILLSGLLLSGCFVFQSPESEFWGRLKPLCGNAYQGELISGDEVDADFIDVPLYISVDRCQGNEIEISFLRETEIVGHWVLTRHADQIELRHVHEGSDVTGYGGFSTDYSSGSRMNFPADEATKAVFDAAGIPASKENVWAISLRSGVLFEYELTRPGREFIVEFDTINAIALPQSPEAVSE